MHICNIYSFIQANFYEHDFLKIRFYSIPSIFLMSGFDIKKHKKKINDAY